MNSQNFDDDEQIILESSSISIKGINFRVILTNNWITLINTSTQGRNHISIQDVQKVKAESSITGDPTILLLFNSPSGENKRMVFHFSLYQKNERDQWLIELENIITSKEKQYRNSIFVDQQVPLAFCSKCGNQVINGSHFCNRCGSKIFIPDQNATNVCIVETPQNTEKRSQISTEKILLPSGKVKSNFYNEPKGTLTNPIKSEPLGFWQLFSTMDRKSPAIVITAICCGIFFLLVMISLIFYVFDSSSNTYSSPSAAVYSLSNPTVIPTEEPLITKDLKMLVLTSEDLPTGWMEVGKTIGSNSIDKQFLFSVGTHGVVFNYNITKFNSITTTKTEFSKKRNGLSNFELISKDRGDEAYGYSDGTFTYYTFRYKNIITEINADYYPPLKISTLETLGSWGWEKMTLN